MAVGCTAGTHISKSQLIVCIIGFVGFTVLALGDVSDYWVTYGIKSTLSSARVNGSSSVLTSGAYSREGLWRVCLQYFTNNSTSSMGHMCYFGLSIPQSLSTSDQVNLETRYEVGFLLGTWVLFGFGVILALIAVVMAIAALRHKKNRTLMKSVAAMFLISAVLSFLGLVIYAVRTTKFMGQWSDDGSPYSSATLNWSFGISWMGLLLCLASGVGHLWIVRRYEDSMI